MKSVTKQITLCVLGTLLEWYDFSLFAALGPIIAETFFPSRNNFAAMILTMLIFASGFIMRPIGAIIFGHLGDKIGRKSTLLITVLIMTISTTAIGLIPTGLTLSTFLLVIFRLAQGFAASGEYPGGITLLAEQISINKNGLVASFGMFAAPAGIFIGTLVCAIISNIIGHDGMIQWGWRLPFLMGAPLGLIGFQIRKFLLESNKFQQAKKEEKLVKIPLKLLVIKHYESFIVLLCMYILSSVSFYINFIYLGGYSLNGEKFGATDALYINSITTLVYSIAILFFGGLSDYVGKQALMIGACILMAFFIYPLFLFILNGDISARLFGQSLISLMIGMFSGPLAALSANLFPTHVRYTGIAISLNISTAIFGGTTPLICAWLSKISNNNIAPAYYFIGIAILAAAVLIKPGAKKQFT